MSEWNNSHAYNNQYQVTNNWNGDANNRYTNTAYYQNPDSQYVSFNEFVSQMQVNNVAAPTTANYNNLHYQNYPANQYNYQNMSSSSQNTQPKSYDYAATSSNVPSEVPSQYALAPDQNTVADDVVLKSNLTATASEFVPKSSIKPSFSYQNVHKESSKTDNGVKETKSSHGSSSDKNWRERPSSSQQNLARQRDSYRQNETKDSYSQNETSRYESNNHRNESNSYNREPNSRGYESNGRNHENNRNNDSNNRYYESNRYENSNRGQKNSSKPRNKDSDRTFYNSSANKNNQDMRGRGEGSGRRNVCGSQRLRAGDRNYADDEQFASNYLQYRDEKKEEQVKEKPAKKQDVSSPVKSKNKSTANQPAIKEMTQRERLSQQLDKGTLECLVCCERVKQIDAVWYCNNCYHVMHLRCIRKWALSSIVESKWRCPACQNTSEEIPSEYRCMCGAVKSPEYQRGGAGAHTCGRPCRRPRACEHPCPLSCHPGPCPPCLATLTRQCGCGAETRSLACSDKTPQVCSRQCGRTLSCGVHTCGETCHAGDCQPCIETVTQVCYCNAGKSRTVACTAETSREDRWCCGEACSLVLPCGAHSCRRPCHPPPCAPCELRPAAVVTCPCGKTRLDPDIRQKCTDPIPLCGNICAKPLQCGPAGDKHFCKESCHQGDCPACPDKTLLQCRCGHSSREVPCADLPLLNNTVLCQKKCNKKLSCGRHRCRSVCCANSTHRCTVVCGRALSCQLHRCEEFCHTGHCAPCPQLSFEELRCECGAQVLYPPVRCGAKPPVCDLPCRRRRPCGHPPHHSCHPGACPPCVVLTARMCHGQHEERKTIPCSQEEFSCGLPCGKPLPCGKHTCIKKCHKGPCDTEKCTQPCNEKRPSCGHPCAAACHPTDSDVCPSAAPCRRLVRATCPCGRRSAERTCSDNARDRAKIMSALAATKMQEGGSVDLSDVQRPGALLKTLDCDDECRMEARARQLALALQIRNPDVSAKLAPRYSDHLRTIATKEPGFAQQIHDRLTELVQLAKKSKQKTRAHSFPSMNWQKRQFIHELCEHFGCESVAYDAEPNRNVVATADREKSWLPAMSVLEVVSREAGKRRVPGPMLRPGSGPALAAPLAKSSSSSSTTTSSGWSTLTSSNAWAARSQARAANTPAAAAATANSSTAAAAKSAPAAPAPKIDYFDNPPE